MKYVILTFHEKYNTLKTNGQSSKKQKYKRWKIIVEWNRSTGLHIFCVLKVSNNHCWAFVFLNCSKKGVVFRIAGWMRNELIAHYISRKLNNVCSYIKKKWVSQTKHDWLTLSYLVTKKIVMAYQEAILGSLQPTFMHQFGWWDFVHFITKP